MRTKAIIALVAVLMVSGISVLAVSGASHNDAPTISEDPVANNTDVYAFVSMQDGREDYVTIIANYLPMLEPGNGPTFSHPSENALYRIHVDLDGDAEEDIGYEFEFENELANESTFLYNTGPIGMPPNPADPSSQYANLNFLQSYTLTVSDGEDGDDEVMLENARVAPNHVGPQSTGTVEEYEALARAGIHTVGETPNQMRVFVGPRDEGFYADLMGAFDLINIRDPGVDAFSGFNVYTIALEIPKSHFTEAGDEDGIIGVWASALRPRTTVLREDGEEPNTSEDMVQVSRMGNPGVNELLMPFSYKDTFNTTAPEEDEDIVDFIINPGSSQGPAALIPLLNNGNGLGFPGTGCTPVNERSDLALVFLTGIPEGTIPGFAGNYTGETQADMLRLNMNIPPSQDPNPLGVLGGDVAGYPNGRRIGDDVIDIALKGAAGGVLQALGALDPANCNVAPLDLSDNVDSNDTNYLDTFPYLGTPHSGYEHAHEHGGPISSATVGIGSGLLASGILLGTVFAIRRRRNSIIQ
jgi:hypothetical protein